MSTPVPLLGHPRPFFPSSTGGSGTNYTIEVRDPDTDILKAIYPTADDAANGTNAISTAITINARGETPTDLFGLAGESYKVVLKDASGSAQWTIAELTLGNGIDSTWLPSFTSATSTTLRAALETTVNVKVHFGATGDGTTDDTAAIQAAIDYLLNSGRRGKVILPPGDYRTTSTLTVSGLSVRLEGESGETATRITADHTAGPVIRTKNRRQGAWNIELYSSATRMAGAAGTNFGLLVEGDDTSTGKADFGSYYNLYVDSQPNHGIVVIGASHHCDFIKCTVRDTIGGHGIVYDNGTLTGRTNKAIPGIGRIIDCQIFDNEGHGILLGNDDDGTSNRAFRMEILQTDLFRNAEAGGSRKSIDQLWAFCDELEVRGCGFDGLNQAQDTATTRAMQVHGREIEIIRNRFLEMNGNAIRVNKVSTYETTVNVRGMHVVQTIGSDLDPAVEIASADYYSVKSKNTLNIDTLVNDLSGGQEKHSEVAFKTSSQAVSSSTTLVNDDDLKVALRPNERVQFKAHLFVDGPTAGDIKVAFTVPSGADLMWGPIGGLKVDSGGTVVSQQVETTSANAIEFGLTTGEDRVITLQGSCTTAGTGGDLQLQFAQVTSDATNTRILNRSWLEAMR